MNQYVSKKLFEVLTEKEIQTVKENSEIRNVRLFELTISELDELLDFLELPPAKLGHLTAQLQHKPLISLYELINR